jgi:hypothetical protein
MILPHIPTKAIVHPPDGKAPTPKYVGGCMKRTHYPRVQDGASHVAIQEELWVSCTLLGRWYYICIYGKVRIHSWSCREFHGQAVFDKDLCLYCICHSGSDYFCKLKHFVYKISQPAYI